MSLKLLGWGLLAAAVVFGAGWYAGASGRDAIERDRRAALARAEAAEARAFVLAGRVSLFQANFGDASRAFESARDVVARAQTRLRQLGDAGRAGQLEVALAQLREAQRLALALDAGAQGPAEQALRVIESVLT
ncbi:MAG TPA: hypothetical protein VFV78_11000 [Vicinamibacterales bacterium]|nr:hypothetical protein [Vicinamibacterales bacterium]